jgi:hypothetical protein
MSKQIFLICKEELWFKIYLILQKKVAFDVPYKLPITLKIRKNIQQTSWAGLQHPDDKCSEAVLDPLPFTGLESYQTWWWTWNFCYEENKRLQPKGISTNNSRGQNTNQTTEINQQQPTDIAKKIADIMSWLTAPRWQMLWGCFRSFALHRIRVLPDLMMDTHKCIAIGRNCLLFRTTRVQIQKEIYYGILCPLELLL